MEPQIIAHKGLQIPRGEILLATPFEEPEFEKEYLLYESLASSFSDLGKSVVVPHRHFPKDLESDVLDMVVHETVNHASMAIVQVNSSSIFDMMIDHVVCSRTPYILFLERGKRVLPEYHAHLREHPFFRFHLYSDPQEAVAKIGRAVKEFYNL